MKQNMPRLTNRTDIHYNRLLKRNQAIPQRDAELENDVRVPVWERVSAFLGGDGGDVAGRF
jgi:hypothetical protein